MVIDDPLLPAAATLVGAEARDAVGSAVAAAGGALCSLRPATVQYRPSHDLVVRYGATVRWASGPPVDEVLVAGTTVDGPPPGSVPVAADGLEVGVWRYPFDPALPGLDAAVRPSSVARLLGLDPGTLPELVVRTYRPCRRAVVEARWEGGRAFLKVVRPAKAASLVAAHERFRSELPVPRVLDADLDAGLVVLEPLPGDPLAARITSGWGPWPSGAALLELSDAISRVQLPDARPAVTPIAMARHHARMLATVVPELAERLDRLVVALGEDDPVAEGASTVHGDLHEGQLTVGPDGQVVGLLDIDAAGAGRPVDDLAVVLAHLDTIGLDTRLRSAMSRYTTRLRRTFLDRVEADDLDRRTAAALVGLATGPFRSQTLGWRRQTSRHLLLAESRLRAAGTGTSAPHLSLTSHL